ncbi:hypothetical protein L6R50_28140, partial [Myxococcota bacterium]|nr:hypothetical protein [Myxococcota bacterium]
SAETWLLQYGTDYDDTTETLTCEAHSDYSLPASASSEAGARFEWLKLQLAPSVSCPDGECGTLRVQPLWFMDPDPLDGVPALADPRPAAIPGDDLATVMALFSGVGPIEEDLLIDVRQLATTGVGVQPVKLQADLGGVDNGVAQRRWPGYVDLADHVGADGVTLGTSDVYAWSAGNVDLDAHPVDPGHGCADDCSAECESACDPDLPSYDSEECALCYSARWRNEGWGLFPTEVIGAKAEIYGFSSWLGPWDDDPGDSYYEGYEAGTGLAKEEMCVAGVTDPDFDMANTWARTGKELDRIANAARLGLSQVLFDFEPDSAVFCPALQDQWDSEWRGDLIATSPGLECTAAVEAEALDSTYTACDGALKDLLREDGHALWSEVYTTLQTGGQEFVTVHSTDRHDPTHPEIGNWRSGPGRFHNGSDGYADVDVLYPQVLSYSMPLIGDYDEETDVTLLRNLLDPGDTGLLVRRDLIGMMALGGTNLLPVAASGFEPDLMEFDFSDRFCDPLGAEGTPEGVVFGPLTDSPELWWNCLVLPGFASESGQAARGFGALTIQPSGYWACSDGDEPQFGEAGCECWPNGAVACEIEGNDTDFGDAFLVGADALGNTAVEPGELYVATVSSRYDLGPDALTPSNARPGLVLVWHKSDGSLAGFSGSDSGVGFRSGVWSNIAVADYAPVNAASVSVGLYAAGVDGHAWFDDVVLAKASLVSNGRMLTAPGTLPAGFGMWIDAGYPVFVEKVSSATGPTHRTSMVETATDHAVQVKWKPGGTGRGGVSQVVNLPPRKVDGFGFAVPFQVSAWFRPSAVGAVPILRVAWWRDGEPAPDPYVSCPASECGALGTAGEWTQVSYSLRAPDDAVAATVYAGAEVASGLVHVDDVDLRVDGPYVVPWMNAGYSRDKGLPSAEVPNSHFHDLLLASFVAGAQRTANNGPAWVDGKDVDEMGSVMAMLSGTGSTDARQRIVADGLPLTGNHLRVLSGIPGRADRAFGMEYDDRLLISVTSLGVADPTHEVMVELKRHQCDLSEVERDGSIGTFLGSVAPAGGTVVLTFTDDDPYRTRLVYGECQPF